MSQGRNFFRKLREDIGFWGRTKIAGWVINNWNTIGWFTFIFTVAFTIFNAIGLFWLGHKIYEESYPDYNDKFQDLLLYVSFFLTILFGLVTLLSLFIAIAVLNSLREIVPDYTQAASSIEKVIKKARHELFILSVNPAFLQVLDPRGLLKWQKTLIDKIESQKDLKVTIAYMERGRLVQDKFADWAADIGVESRDLSERFLNDYIFSVARNTSYRDNFTLIPLNTKNIPFVIAIADDDMAMFCHSIIYPKIMGSEKRSVKSSVMKGVISYDQNIVQAIKEVYYQIVKLNAGTYRYQCNKCNAETYLFDHEIIEYGGQFTVDNLFKSPKLSCNNVFGILKLPLIIIVDLLLFSINTESYVLIRYWYYILLKFQCDCDGELIFDSLRVEKLIRFDNELLRNSLYEEVTGRKWV